MLAAEVIVDVAEINPPVNTLPPVMLAVAVTVLAEITLAPVKLPPDPPATIKLPPVMLPVAEISPPVRMFPPVMLPVALAVPPVSKLPPVIVPVELTKPPVRMLPPVMLAALVIVDVAEINPPVNKLPPATLPATLNVARVPTLVKLELTTPLARVLPVNAFAGAVMLASPAAVNWPC